MCSYADNWLVWLQQCVKAHKQVCGQSCLQTAGACTKAGAAQLQLFVLLMPLQSSKPMVRTNMGTCMHSQARAVKAVVTFPVSMTACQTRPGQCGSTTVLGL